ncbi:uncharacterized protein BCR38DRAFT_449254 [Pseudomassariella vexata]|uniref:Uncharacterized protein n=1 Tax=Pseudomassariella vexata TaxID=1141098 RepID=A0A1Y2DE21_9PEZI|nr:uncharacterized protein BCR38DRAFT_449254 [Pseudomassariella vexata]ORY57489.1 hypothetical protein BCR38DRAFT_449254 [Pseudomassariella vexata]
MSYQTIKATTYVSRTMCFKAEPSKKYYYHEEVIPVRQVHAHHHHHRSHAPRASYHSSHSPRVSQTSYRRSGPVVYQRTSQTRYV